MRKGKIKRPAATVADVLGIKSARPKIPRKWQQAYDRLVKLREGFERQQDSISRDVQPSDQHSGMHMADAGTDASEQDLALGIVSLDRNNLHEIDRAIERIQEGTYGVCELTGKPISLERLKAVPWARFSANAEKQLEREGYSRRAAAGRRAGASVPEPNAEEAAESEAD